jgi:hypothetical protein
MDGWRIAAVGVSGAECIRNCARPRFPRMEESLVLLNKDMQESGSPLKSPITSSGREVKAADE